MAQEMSSTNHITSTGRHDQTPHRPQDRPQRSRNPDQYSHHPLFLILPFPFPFLPFLSFHTPLVLNHSELTNTSSSPPASATGKTITFTPSPTLPSGNYALSITQSGSTNYSPSFPLECPNPPSPAESPCPSCPQPPQIAANAPQIEASPPAPATNIPIVPGQPLNWGSGNNTNGSWATATPGGWATPTGAEVLATETRLQSAGNAMETIVGVRYVCGEGYCTEGFTGGAGSGKGVGREGVMVVVSLGVAVGVWLGA